MTWLADLAGARWDGTFRTDDDTIAEVAGDFGHLVHHRPAAVLQARSTSDVATVLRTASAERVPVVARGMGHSTDGQSQVPDGVVVDTRGLDTLGPIVDDRITVGAGATWRSVVSAAFEHGLTPPVLADYLGLSVGGTLSVGGIGGTSHRHGMQTDNVAELEVVTGDGVVHTCSAARETDLFDAARAGLGQHGIITAATLPLVPAPNHVRRYLLSYPSVEALTAEQRMLLRDGRFAYLEGQILIYDNGFRFLLEVAAFDPRDDADLLDGLHDDRSAAVIEDLDLVAFADRLAVGEAFLRSTGEWLRPHPWWNAFLPDSAADAFLTGLTLDLTPADLGATGLVLCYPVPTRPLRTPLVRVPDAPLMFLVGLLRTSTVDMADQAVADNTALYRAARSVGGHAYPVSSIPVGPQDWMTHFGPLWPTMAAAKKRFDPNGILGSGQRIFTTG